MGVRHTGVSIEETLCFALRAHGLQLRLGSTVGTTGFPPAKLRSGTPPSPTGFHLHARNR